MKTTSLSSCLLLLSVSGAMAGEVLLPCADAAPGPVFEGLGALSAGASTRLLPDYPEPQRSQVLDLLFAPKVGAALQHLKVEIGGEVNSTCGTEPTHRRSREEKPDYTRGYEWWLMREARRRNPTIPLDTLAWGAPAWIGNGTYYSQDMADYVADFIAGAQTAHGLDIAFTGIWNERSYDIPWIKLLRRTLDARGLRAVQIVAADQCVNQWAIAKDMAKDPELAAAVAVIGEHYPGCHTSAEAKSTGKRLWAAEDGPWRGDWSGACQLARVYNRNFIVGGMVRTVIWSLVSSYYDNLPLPGSGLMRANTPWSGAYELQPALWVTAHTTQTTEPGWRYLGGNCCQLIPGGSVVSLVSPSGQDLSVIAESTDTDQPTTLTITVPAALANREFHPWLTTATAWFQPQPACLVKDGRLTVTLPPRAILSLTTTTGQRRAVPSSPADQAFPSPYRDDFSTTQVGHLGRYLSDQGGVFEVVAQEGQRYLRQQVAKPGIDWQPTPEPETFLGDTAWEDQSIRVRARIEPDAKPAPGRYLAVYARVGYVGQNSKPAPGYGLRVHEDGRWELRDGARILAQGTAQGLGNAWHHLELRAKGEQISALLDGQQLAQCTDQARAFGQAGIGSGWHQAGFANLEVQGIKPHDLARGVITTASSKWDDRHGPERATDGIAADGLSGPTRWNSGEKPLPEEWIALDFGATCTWNRVRLVPYEDRNHTLSLQSWNGTDWTTIATTTVHATPVTIDVPDQTSQRLRLVAHDVKQSLSLYDLQVFCRSVDAR